MHISYTFEVVSCFFQNFCDFSGNNQVNQCLYFRFISFIGTEAECVVSHTIHKYIAKFWMVENLLLTLKQCLVFRRVCFVDARLCGLSKQDKILVSDIILSTFSGLFIQKTIKQKCFPPSTIVLQLKKSIFSRNDRITYIIF